MADPTVTSKPSDPTPEPPKSRPAAEAIAAPKEPLGPSVAARVQEIVDSAEQKAYEMQRDLEVSTKAEAASIRASADADAARIRREAEMLVERWLADSRERIDSYTDSRIRRIDELSDGLVSQADQLQQRFDGANRVRSQIYDLIGALGDAAERLSRESARPEVEIPGLSRHAADRPIELPTTPPAPPRAAEERGPGRGNALPGKPAGSGPRRRKAKDDE